MQSYLGDHTLAVLVNESISKLSMKLKTGVKQGSILGPLLFYIYMLDLYNIIRKYRIFSHGYLIINADDIIYTSDLN